MVSFDQSNNNLWFICSKTNPLFWSIKQSLSTLGHSNTNSPLSISQTPTLYFVRSNTYHLLWVKHWFSTSTGQTLTLYFHRFNTNLLHWISKTHILNTDQSKATSSYSNTLDFWSFKQYPLLWVTQTWSFKHQLLILIKHLPFTLSQTLSLNISWTNTNLIL